MRDWIQITQKHLYLSCFFCTETFTSAPPLGCTAIYGNRLTALVYILITRRVPRYLVSYLVGYPGNELPGNGSPSYDVDSIVNFSANVVRRSTHFRCPSVCLWCAYNCVTAHKTLEVDLMSVSLSTGIITFIHFAFLFNRKKQHEHTLSLLSLFLENKRY